MTVRITGPVNHLLKLAIDAVRSLTSGVHIVQPRKYVSVVESTQAYCPGKPVSPEAWFKK